MVYSTELKETEILCRNAKVFLDNDDHNIEIMLLKHGDQNCLEVIGYDQVQGKESNRLYLNAKKVRAKLSRKSIDDLSKECFFHTLSQQLQNDQLNRIIDSLTVDFVLSRLNCIVATEGGEFSITMNSLINESIKANECGIVDFPSFQFSSLPSGVIPYRTNRPKHDNSNANDTKETEDPADFCSGAEPLPHVRRPSVALPNVFATSGKHSQKHSTLSGKGGVEAALAAARAALQPASSSVTLTEVGECGPFSGKSSGSGGGEGSSKPSAAAAAAAAPTRRRTFEALTSLASRVIPSALVPINRQHSAGANRLHRSNNNNNQHNSSSGSINVEGSESAAAPAVGSTSSLLARRRKEDSRSLGSLLPALTISSAGSGSGVKALVGTSPTVLIKPALSPIEAHTHTATTSAPVAAAVGGVDDVSHASSSDPSAALSVDGVTLRHSVVLSVGEFGGVERRVVNMRQEPTASEAAEVAALAAASADIASM